MACSTSAIALTIASRSSNPTATFVKEAFVAKNTLGDGSVFDITFSKDPQQKYIYLADGVEHEGPHHPCATRWRSSRRLATAAASPASSTRVHSIATDSKGNIFTTETYRGQRVQKFLYKGLATVTKKDQGVVWPTVSRK